MAEMVLAVGLLALMVVFVAGLFTRLLAASSKSSTQTVGLLFAQRRLDAAQRNGPPNWGAASPISEVAGNYREGSSDSQGVYLTDEAAQTTFFYRFEANRVESKPMGDLYRLSVDVVWWPSTGATAKNAQPGETGHGTGKQSVSLARVFYQHNVK